MSDEQSLVITKKGLEECISAKSNGILLDLKWVSAGDKDYLPDAEQTSLANEIERVEFGEYLDLGNNQVKAVGKFSGEGEYLIKELGFWLASGTLFGVVSSPGVTLNYKAKGGVCIQPFTLDLSALPSDSVQVVVGTESLNILLDLEMMMDAVAFVRGQTVQVKQANSQMRLSERIRMMEAKGA